MFNPSLHHVRTCVFGAVLLPLLACGGLASGTAPDAKVDPSSSTAHAAEDLRPFSIGKNAHLLGVSADGRQVAWTLATAAGTTLYRRDLRAGPTGTGVRIAEATSKQMFETVSFSTSGRWMAFTTLNFATERDDLYVAAISQDDTAVTTLVAHNAMRHRLGFWPDRDALLYAAGDSGSYGPCTIRRYDPETARDEAIAASAECPVSQEATSGPISPNRSKMLVLLPDAGRVPVRVYDFNTRAVQESGFFAGGAWGDGKAQARFLDDDHVTIAEDTRMVSWNLVEQSMREFRGPAGVSYEISAAGRYGITRAANQTSVSFIDLRTGDVTRNSYCADRGVRFSPDDQTAFVCCQTGADRDVCSVLPLAALETSTHNFEVQSGSFGLGSIQFFAGMAWAQAFDQTPVLELFTKAAHPPIAFPVDDDLNIDRASALSDGTTFAFTFNRFYGPIRLYDAATGSTRPLAAPLDTAYGRANAEGLYAGAFAADPKGRTLVVVVNQGKAHDGVQSAQNVFVVDSAEAAPPKRLATLQAVTVNIEHLTPTHVLYQADYAKGGNELFAAHL
jgi:hypothetical protein